MMRGRTDGSQKKRLLTTFVLVAAVLFLYLYFGSQSQGESALEYGSRSLRKLGSSYLGGDEESDLGNKQDDFKFGLDDDDGIVPKSFPVCDDRYSELIPCLDRNLIYQMRLKLDLSLMEHYERHCPLPERRFNCLIPPPTGYKVPIKWPKSRDEVWKANIPHTHLATEKSDQNWMVVKGEKIIFPGGGTHFHYGADKYIKSLANMLNFSKDIINNEGNLRTVLDVGCGVASFGGYLLSSDIIAMSLAPNDVHQNQIQFALERGIPAYLGVLGTKRLPYPSRSFELAHCSRCRIDWLQRDGILLLELDRLLRPGGYFAYSSPEAYAQDEEDLRIWKEMSALVERMCWKIAAKRNQTVIWVKPLTNDCYMERAPGTQPPLCRSDDDPDAVYGVNMETCITPYSEHEVWKANIPHTHLATEKSDQNWMVVKGEKIIFPGGGTHFHYGADKYIKSLANMLNFSKDIINNEGNLRTVLDVGCGVASFGGYLLSSDIIAMSLAPNDVHQNQIQFALERGIPAYLGVLGTKRLPYPSRSFELAHCSRCRIDWLQRDGILLLELDRLLRPGGYFAYSSPEAYAQDEEDLRIWKEMSALVERMCWKIAAKRNQTVIWVKPLTNDCYMERAPGTQPPLCRSDDDPDAVYGVNMETCITPYSEHLCRTLSVSSFHQGSGLAPWPARLTSPPPRLADFGYSKDMFEKDTELWRKRVENYWDLLSPKISTNTIRNVMDMKANLGSFGAALGNKDVWVMNVVPEDGPNTLKLIYDRGLIGSIHSWCEAYSTYPRTYDLLHASNVFSDIVEKKGCSGEDLLIEIDRILRPTGFLIIRDKKPVIDFVKKYLPAIHWETVAMADSSSESDADDDVLIVQKKLWLTSHSLRETD